MLENVNVKKLFGGNEGKKSIVQDMLSSLLKVTYPYISQAKKWTDMRTDLSSSQETMKITLMPKYLPQGYEDKTELDVGFKIEKNIFNLTKVNVWRMNQIVCYEHNDAMFCKPFISEASPVDMEDAKSGHPGPFTISAPEEASDKWIKCLGDYTLAGELHNDRPVYRNSEGRHLYTMESGDWAVYYIVGDRYPFYRSTDQAFSPALCQNWEYREPGSSEYKQGDIKVTVKQ